MWVWNFRVHFGRSIVDAITNKRYDQIEAKYGLSVPVDEVMDEWDQHFVKTGRLN